MFIVPQVLTWIDIGISIGGYVTVAKKETGQLLPTPFSIAGISLLFVIFLYTVGVYIYFCFHKAQYGVEEKSLLTSVGACCPILLLRVIYSLIFIITADMTWNAVKGNALAYLLMTMLPEVVFIAICALTIRNISPLKKNEPETKDLSTVEESRL